MFKWIHSLWLNWKPVLSGKIDVWIDEAAVMFARYIKANKEYIKATIDQLNEQELSLRIAEMLKAHKNRQL